jgi:alpha-ketoglutaric semialdehyde dehydrogenase
MIPAPILLDGSWKSARATAVFTAFDPTTGLPFPEPYPISGFPDIEEAVASAGQAAREMETIPPTLTGAFLDRFAEGILRRADDLVEIAHSETALPKEPRLRTTELPRTLHQLHQAADAARDGSWRQATIDSKLNIRSIRGPLGGPVVVFGPSNFPFAFNSAAGGDFAAALAAGNPVIAKGHPSHPGTTRLFAETARDAMAEVGFPRAAVQLLYHFSSEDGLRFVSDPRLGATAFTGSRRAGLRLKQAADSAGKPIYLEMSSLNPLFLLPGAVTERGAAIAAELFASCSLGTGQFCTKPGLAVVLDGDSGRNFLAGARERFQSSPSGYLLNLGVRESVQAIVAELTKNGAVLLAGGHLRPEPGYRFENTLLTISGERFLRNAVPLQAEAFGPVTMIVLAESEEVLIRIAEALEGNLSACVYAGADGRDEALYDRLASILRPKTGRLLNDKMPTGLAVVPAMVHGGPYPATGHPGFTSVGFPASILRFTALRGYDNVRPHRLPAELRDENPTGTMWRLIDGTWTRGDAGS